MDTNGLLSIIRHGEGECVEFKRDLSEKGGDKLAEIMSAFANTSGGHLIVGVEDDNGSEGELLIRGVASVDAVHRSLATDARQKCRPPLHPTFETVEVDGSKVVVVRIEPSVNTYHFANGRIYVRVGATNQQVTDPTELERMRRKLPSSFTAAEGSLNAPPPEPIGFSGREGELHAVGRYLEGPIVVLAIEGISGIGKTAMAIRLASLATEVGYNVFWQVCHPLTTLEAVLSNLSSFARVHGDDGLAEVIEEPVRALEDRLSRLSAYLSERRLVLVLDDYHLVEDPGIRRLILSLGERSQTTKVVLTVRSRPTLMNSCQRAEELQLLEGLDAPACGTFLSERGVTVDQPGIRERVWGKTGRGHPKALQILAARARTFPLDRLLDSLPVFAEDIKSEWLEPLLRELPNGQREALMDFCVFARFLPLRAMSVSSPERRYEEMFVALADRFIVDPAQPDSPQVHQLIREYALGQLGSMQARHEWAAKLYEEQCGEVDPYEVLSQAQKEALLAAWEHFVLAGNHDEATRIVRGLRATLTVRGELDQLMLLLERTIPTAEHKDWFEIDKARILDLWDSSNDAISLIEPLVDSKDARVAREAVLVLATIHLDRGRAREADELLARHWSQFVKRTGTRVMVRFLSRFVEVQLQLGHLDRAVELSTEIRRVCDIDKDKIGTARSLRYMGTAFVTRGGEGREQGVQMLLASRDLLNSEGRLREAAISERQLGLALRELGRTEDAKGHLTHALATFEATGDRQNAHLCRDDLIAL